MRIALSLLVCFLSAFLFSLSANAGYSDELALYNNCKKKYINGSCESVPVFSKKSLIEKSATCSLSAEAYATIENSIACSKVNSINKTCADHYEKQVSLLAGNFCAKAGQAAQAAAAAAQPKPAATSPSAAANDGSSMQDADVLARGVIIPVIGALEKKEAKAASAAAAQAASAQQAAARPAQQVVAARTTQSSATPSSTTAEPIKSAAPAYSAAKDSQQANAGMQAADAAKKGEAPVKPNLEAEMAKPPDAQANANAVTAGQAIISDLAATVSKAVPVAAEAAKGLASVKTVGDAAAKEATAAMTTAAESADQALTVASQGAKSQSAKLVASQFPMALSKAAIDGVSTQIDAYLTAKKACETAASRSEFLCVEGSSPGMQAAKTVMDVAGPALALINSAQKSCSTTADVARLVGTGLTIAKGVCVAAKVMCDTTCGSVRKQLAAIQANLKTVPAAIVDEAEVIDIQCVNLMNGVATASQGAICAADLQKNATVAEAIVTKLKASVLQEETPTLGTTPGLVLKCQSHMKDIALLAINILGTWQAKKGADECAKKLETAGNTSPAEYCAQPANVATSYCKCLKDNSQMGCAGHISAGLSTDTNGNTNDQGSVQRGSGGASGFAGPGVGNGNINVGKVTSPIAGGVVGSDPVKNSKDAKAGGGFGGTASGGGAGLGGGGSPELGSANLAEKKKWSFGAFMGGGGGGSAFGSGKGGAKGSGNIGTRDLDTQRALASEQQQFRAEVSEASGRSNWEKVRERYLRKTSSLLER